jgi:2-(1,2-epoxy-1,2-dihydrophenyl)acetyl-CoA isomerase
LTRIATITLNRPATLNALSVEMMEDLFGVVRRVRESKSVDVVMIAGAGDHFMAGGDLKDFALHLDLAPQARLVAFRAMIEKTRPTMTNSGLPGGCGNPNV